MPFSTRLIRAVTAYVAGGRTTWYAPIESDGTWTFAALENVRSAETRIPPLNVVTPDTRPRTVVLSRLRVAVMSYDTAVAPEETWRLPVNVTRTNLWTPEIAIVVRASTVTAKSPSGTWSRYVPAGSLSTWNVPPWTRS